MKPNFLRLFDDYLDLLVINKILTKIYYFFFNWQSGELVGVGIWIFMWLVDGG